jgi:three-Cys-motif partner protein
MPENTIWEAEPHTLAKHTILRRYLEAWLPIMLREYSRIVYIDGFAGPGIYAGGEPGSPIIALDVASKHGPLRLTPPKGTLDIFFIEEREDRFRRLESEIVRTVQQSPLPQWVTQTARRGTFDTEVLDILELFKRKRQSPPRLVFADPFGFSDVPMEVVKSLMLAPSSELFLFFNYADMYRFLAVPEKAATYDRMYLSQDWRQLAREPNERTQREQLLALYARQLKQHARFQFVWPFELVDLVHRHYFLIFGTRNKEGLRQMKAAYWKTDPERGRVFVDPKYPNQIGLLPATSSLQQLPAILRNKFQGKRVDISVVADFVLSETDFSDTIHLRHRTLLKMETSTPPQIEVTGRKRPIPGQYKGAKILFL